MKGLLILAGSIILLLSVISFTYHQGKENWLGLMGDNLGWLLHAGFGVGSFLFCLYFTWLGCRLIVHKTTEDIGFKSLNIAVAIVSACMLFSLAEDQFPAFRLYIGNTLYANLWQQKLYYHLGGTPFFYIYKELPTLNLYRIFNALGVGIVFTSTLVTSLLFLMHISPAMLAVPFQWLGSKIRGWFQRNPAGKKDSLMRFVKVKIPSSAVATQAAWKSNKPQDEGEFMEINPEQELKERPSLSRKRIETRFPAPRMRQPQVEEPPPRPTKQLKRPAPRHLSKREAAIAAQRVYNGDFAGFALPSNELLTSPKKMDQSALKKNLKRQAEVLEETLSSFGIEAKVGQINCGPTITSFEVHPAIGVKVQKIKALESDIALNMEAKSIRIIAPIPGKAAIGIEVPNPQPQEVAFKDILAAYQRGKKRFHIPALLGKTVNGDYVMSDLAKMPHCIIAGATGSGKSVCINTIIMSILMNARPDEVKLMMIDPKKVELTPYSKLPHMLAPVITEPQGACAALHWLVKEMEKRYELLKQIGVRNIDAFNKRTVDKDFEESLGIDVPEKLHYIVGIIDELADLMMVSSNDIETPIARIAQMARAVGIHLILATQRPSREVITGLIKANFPTRISFKVSSRINSQIVLDETGAETLLGNGDMLFLPPGASHLTRAQGAFIRDEDINTVIKQICDQAPPNYAIDSFDEMDELAGLGSDDEAEKKRDSLYDSALTIIQDSGSASTTFLQRKLKIGYARAAGLIDQLEDEGVVGPSSGSKPRQVLIGKETEIAPIEEEVSLSVTD